MKRRGWVVAFVIVIGLLLGFYCLYRYGGLKYYLKALRYVDDHPSVWSDFYGNREKQVYGGIIAWVSGKGVWIWGRSGLTYFRGEEDSDYNRLISCRGEGGNPSLRSIETYESLGDWGRDYYPGDYVFVNYESGWPGKIRKGWSADHWVFIEGNNLSEQCAARTGEI